MPQRSSTSGRKITLPALGPLIILIVTLIVLLGTLWVVPRWQASQVTRDPKESFEIENKARATLSQVLAGLGGSFFFLTAYFTWQQVQTAERTRQIAEANREIAEKSRQLAEDKQISERFTKAVEMLADKDDRLDVRLGGIYSLKRIAYDSPREEDRWVIIELLAAYIRRRGKEPQPLSEDLQVALNIIGLWQAPEASRISLESACLHKARFDRARLDRADFRLVDFREASFEEANLVEARFGETNLTKATFAFAKLQGAIFLGATLKETKFVESKLQKARFREADLQGASFRGSNLEGADFRDAKNLDPKQFKKTFNWEKALYDLDFAEKLGLSIEDQKKRAAVELEIIKSFVESDDARFV